MKPKIQVEKIYAIYQKIEDNNIRISKWYTRRGDAIRLRYKWRYDTTCFVLEFNIVEGEIIEDTNS